MENSNNEIQLLDVVKSLWEYRKLFRNFLLTGLLLGVIIYLISEKEYTVQSKYLPQVSSSQGKGLSKGLGGLASLAGINLSGNSQTNELPPTLYPILLENVEVQVQLLHSKIKIRASQDSITFKDYLKNYYRPSALSYIKKYTVGLPGEIIKLVRGSNESETSPVDESAKGIYKLSLGDEKLIKKLLGMITVDSKIDEGTIVMEVTMSDPVIASQLALHLEEIILERVKRFKTQNAQKELDFLLQRLRVQEMTFREAQNNLAKFKDENQGLSLASAQTRLTVLQSDYDLAFNLFLELSNQVEQARLQVAKDTPLLNIIKPIRVPNTKSGPSAFVTLFLSILFALITATVRVLILKNKSFIKGLTKS